MHYKNKPIERKQIEEILASMPDEARLAYRLMEQDWFENHKPHQLPYMPYRPTDF